MKKLALAIVAIAGISSSQATQFNVTIENLGPQGLSRLFWVVSNENYNLFELDGTASTGIKNIAERGNTDAALAEAAAAGAAVGSFGALASSVAPGGSRSGTFNTTAAHGYFQFATMLGRTNDAFLGESVSTSGLFLFDQQGNARGFSMLITGLRAWDAGTELNTQNAADLGFLGGSGNPADSITSIRIHDTITANVGDSFSQMPDWELSTPLARVTVTPVPEPATVSALVAGLAALRLRGRKKIARG